MSCTKFDIGWGFTQTSRSVADSAEQVQLNKQQFWCGGAYPDCYPVVTLTYQEYLE